MLTKFASNTHWRNQVNNSILNNSHPKIEFELLTSVEGLRPEVKQFKTMRPNQREVCGTLF